MRMRIAVGGGFAAVAGIAMVLAIGGGGRKDGRQHSDDFLGDANQNAQQLVDQGRKIFRFDTYGDEAFWGGQLRLHEAVATLSPKQALDLGLKVDAQALGSTLANAIKQGQVNLNDPAVTAQLLKANAVL